jgi:hypothetical protein
LPLELAQILVRLEESVLNHVLSVFAILRDVLSDSEHVPVVAPDQLLERADVAATSSINQYCLCVSGVAYFGFDGFHDFADSR